VGNLILNNSIFGNQNIGIDLNADGVTPDDYVDFDTGPNNFENYPTIASAIISGSSVQITWSLYSHPNTTYIVQFFASNGICNGQYYLSQVNATTDSSGNTGTLVTDLPITSGTIISATATDPTNDTSEFSGPAVTSSSVPTVTHLSTSTGSTGGGTSVTITGPNFTNVLSVWFGGMPATNFTVNSPTSITVLAPAQAAGTVAVTITNASGTSALVSADLFTYTVAPLPTVTGLSSNSGVATGGNTITITGLHFLGAFGVAFGSVEATSFVVTDASHISVVVPGQVPNLTHVQVFTYSGTSAVSSTDQYTYFAGALPTLSGINVTSGPTSGGSTIIITGSHFTGTTAVFFGTVQAPYFNVVSDGYLTVTVPAQPAGVVYLSVQTYNGTSTASSTFWYTFVAGACPTISNLSFTSASTSGGQPVTILGSGFTAAAAVSFGSVPAYFVVNSDTSITAWAPASLPGAIDITVTTYNGTSAASLADRLTFVTPTLPTITSISPALGSAAGGTLVTLTGSGFRTATEIDIGYLVIYNFTVLSDTQATFIMPDPPAGAWDVLISNDAGTSTADSTDQFTFTLASPPSVTGLSSTTGTTASGAIITLSGSNFTGASAVFFGNFPAVFTVDSDSTITAIVPAQYAGTVDVTVSTDSGTSAASSADQYVYTTGSAPIVTSLGTSSGSTGGGTLVTLFGSNFADTVEVLFGTVPAYFVVDSDSSITAYAPPQAAGTFDVTVINHGGGSSTSSSDLFTYNAAPAPAVTALSPTSGPASGGYTITLIGSDFSGASGVSFSSSSYSIPYDAADFVVNSDSSITASVPELPQGTFDVLVTTLSGTSSATSADQFTANAVSGSAPTVTAVSSGEGNTSGGASVILTGTGFTGASAVTFIEGSGLSVTYTPAASFEVLSDTELMVTVPLSQPAGTCDITVTTGNGTSTTSSADQYVFTSTSLPSVSGLATTGSSAGGTSVDISGSSFTGATAVYFGIVAAASFTVNSDTSVTAIAPAQLAGTVDVSVVTPVGSSAATSADQFVYPAAPSPTVTSLATTSGSSSGGTSVDITGTNFTAVTGVFFGGAAAASFVVNSSTSISAVAPTHGAGAYDVTVSTVGGMSALSSGDRFSFTVGSAPTVSGLSTGSGSTAGGTSVDITGTDFTPTSTVFFGLIPAAGITFNSATSLTVIAPPAQAGSVDVKVATYTGESATNSADAFTYSAAAAPTVSGLSSSGGSTAGGDLLTITGSNFTGAIGVSFGTVSATFTIDSDTSITAWAPTQAAGTVDVAVTTFAGTSSLTSADQYTYTAASAPTITAITPAAGYDSGGTLVTLLGTDFTGTTSVQFGSTPANGFTVLSPTAILATAPAGSTGTVDITVTTFGGTSGTSSADVFTYSADPVPSVSSLSSSGGSTGGGDTITISGSNVSAATGVFFGSTPAASFLIVSDTVIEAISPPSTAETVDVTVPTLLDTSALSSADLYTYNAASAPALTSLSSSTGTVTGGDTITLTGTDFTGAGSVTFGGVAASFTITSSTTITATVPAQAAATVDVVVTTPTGTSAISSADQYTYTTSTGPSVTGLSETSGSTAGGDLVNILGSNFTAATGVSFGTVATSFTVQNDGWITALIPSQAAATVDVTVTTFSGTSSTSSADQYTYSSAGAPSVTAVGPTGGDLAGGNTVTLLGSGFTVLSDTALLAVAPAGVAGAVDITVTTPSGTSATTSADQYTYADESPSTGSPSFSTLEDQLLTIDAASGVLSVASDPSSLPMVVTLITGTEYGTVVLNPDGSFVYTPAPGYQGGDSFTYQVTDGLASSIGLATITVTPVNDLTVSNPTVSTAEDTPLTGNILTGAVDSEGDAITATAGTFATANGSVTIANDGSYTYTPTAGYIGSDSFSFTAQTGDDSTNGTVSITVTAVNDLTVLSPSVSTNEDTPLTGNVLTGAVDSEGAAITAVAGTFATANGSVTIASDGNYTYTPSTGYHGSDSFSFTAQTSDDSTGGTTSISITIVDDLTVSSPSVSTAEDTPLTGNVLTGAVDSEGAAITATAGTFATAHGSVTIASDGSYTYTPSTGYNGSDSFSFTGQTSDDSTSGTVSITVTAVNDLTVVSPSVSTNEDTPLTGNVLTGAVDSEGAAISATAGTFATAHGTVTIASDGSYTYIPNAGYQGSDSFTFTAQTGDDSTSGTVSITVTPVNDLSVSSPSVSTSVNTPLTGNVLTGAVDSESAAITATAGTFVTANGSVTIAGDGSYTYTPNTGFQGNDSFSFTAQTSDDTSYGTVFITVS